MEGPAATDDLTEQWGLSSLRPDDEDVMVFWLALAATQWKAGRLEDRVRDKAIDVIDSGKDLGRWEEAGPKDLKKRKQGSTVVPAVCLRHRKSHHPLTISVYSLKPAKTHDVVSADPSACDGKSTMTRGMRSLSLSPVTNVVRF